METLHWSWIVHHNDNNVEMEEDPCPLHNEAFKVLDLASVCMERQENATQFSCSKLNDYVTWLLKNARKLQLELNHSNE